MLNIEVVIWSLVFFTAISFFIARRWGGPGMRS